MAGTGIILRKDTKENFLQDPPIQGELVFAIDTYELGMINSSYNIIWTDFYTFSSEMEKLNNIEENANNYILPVGGANIGGVKSGTDISIDQFGNVSVRNNTHLHTIGNITNLRTELDQLRASIEVNKTNTNARIDNLEFDFDSKQDTLISSVNLKTINGNSLLGAGDITLSTSSSSSNGTASFTNIDGTVDTFDYTSSVNGKIGDVVLTIDDIFGAQDQINSKQDILESAVNIKTVNGHSIVGAGNVDLNTHLTLHENELRYTNIDGSVLSIDLSKYLDNTNYSRIESGAFISGENVIKLTRDDTSTIEIDVSLLLDDTNIITTVAGRTGDIVIGISDVTDLQANLDSKQPNLQNQVNIKSVNGTSLLGAGDIDLSTNFVLNGNTIEYTNIDGTVQTVPVVSSIAGRDGAVTLSSSDLTDIAIIQADIDSKQPTLVSGSNIKTINGKSLVGSGNIVFQTDLTLSNNILYFTNTDGLIQEIDLTLFLDDSNLARITQGVYDNNTQTLIFTRDNNSTFSVDASMFFDDTNLVTSINGYTGAVDLTKADVQLGLADNTADIDKNVNSALTLTTPRNITLSGDASGTVSFDGSVNVDLAVTVADDSHNHIIANIDGLQDALDNKLDYGTYVSTTSEQALDPFTPFEAGVNELVLNRGDGFANRIQVKTIGGNTILGSGDITLPDVDAIKTTKYVLNPVDAFTATETSITLHKGNNSSETIQFKTLNGVPILGVGELEVDISNSVVSTALTAVNGNRYFADTTSAAFTITLPATPSDGTRLIIHDVTGNFATNNLTVDRNGETILGLAENLILDVNNGTTELIYINNDWRIM